WVPLTGWRAIRRPGEPVGRADLRKVDRAPGARLGGPADLLRVDRAPRAGPGGPADRVRVDRLVGEARQSAHAAAAPGTRLAGPSAGQAAPGKRFPARRRPRGRSGGG